MKKLCKLDKKNQNKRIVVSLLANVVCQVIIVINYVNQKQFKHLK